MSSRGLSQQTTDHWTERQRAQHLLAEHYGWEEIQTTAQNDPAGPTQSRKLTEEQDVLRDLSLQGRHLRPERNEELPPRRADTIGLRESQVQRLLAATQGVSDIIQESRNMLDMRRNAGSTLQV